MPATVAWTSSVRISRSSSLFTRVKLPAPGELAGFDTYVRQLLDKHEEGMKNYDGGELQRKASLTLTIAFLILFYLLPFQTPRLARVR
jgi:hypothetical protein